MTIPDRHAMLHIDYHSAFATLTSTCSRVLIHTCTLRWIMLLCCSLAFGLAHADFDGGDGSAEAPWLIATAQQLDEVRADLDAHYRVVGDLDLSGSAWIPIGTEAAPFTGHLDGGHHVINGLNINSPETNNIALFAFADGARLRNLVLENVDVHGDWWVAGLVARAENTVIANSSVTGNIAAEGPYVGAIAASAGKTVISGSYAAGGVTGTNYTGGIAGIMSSAWLINSYSLTDVSGAPVEYRGVGGLTGNSSHLTIQDSFFAGTLTTGGAEFPAGVLTGYNGFGTMSNSFWDADHNSGLNAIGQQLYAGTVEQVTAYNTASMTDEQTFLGAGWNFTSIWAIDPGVNNGYPYQRWQQGLITDSPPLAFPGLDDRNINIDAPFSLDLREHFVDPDAGALSFTVAGDLPQGLEFDAATGVISGIPTLQDSHTLQITAMDSGPNHYTATASFTLNVQPAFVGEGTVASPWEIDTAEKLDAVRNVLEAHFILVADIDLADSDWSAGWQPIGSATTPFEGSFDGNGFSISGLVVNAADGQRAGLFGRVFDAELRAIDLIEVQVTGYGFVGGLAGAASRSIITDTRVSGTVAVASDATSGSAFGGLVGSAEGSQISQSEFSGTVTGRSETGGLVGRVATSGVIRDTHADASVSGMSRVGGLVGFLHAAQDSDPDNQALIETSHAHGSVTGDDSIGGLVGETMYATVNNSHAGGEVSGDNRTGGLFGYVHSSSVVNDVYFQGSVWGRVKTAGVAGEMINSQLTRAYVANTTQGVLSSAALIARAEDADVNNSFWHEALAHGKVAVAEGVGNNIIDAAALSALAIQTRETFVDAGWDFTATWDMQAGGGLPYQQWAPEFFSSPPLLLNTIPDSVRLAQSTFELALHDLIVDPEGGELSFTVSGLPTGVSFDDNTGLISGSTQSWGNHAITITAINEREETLEVEFTLSFLPYTRGNGALNDRWHVETAEQFRAMGLRPGDHYMLIEDIDLGGVEWSPVGTPSVPFTGSLHGNYYTIDGLTINAGENTGLFGVTDGATLTRIRIDAASVTGGDNVGILVGRAIDTEISQVSVSGEVLGNQNTGGLAGVLNNGSLVQGHADVNVDAAQTVGGLVGSSANSPISDSYVSGTLRVSGFIAGGMFGAFENDDLTNSYSNVAVVDWENAMFSGAMAGFRTNLRISNVFWNDDLMPGMNPGGMDTDVVSDDISTGLSTDALKDPDSYPDANNIPDGWDFDTIWAITPNINDGLPYLRWMAPNAMPTLTQFDSAQFVIDEDTELWLRGYILEDASDAADEDGGVAAFVIKSVVSGTLLIGDEPFDAISNNAIDHSVGAYWTPPADANGLLPALRMVVRDNRGLESANEVLLSVQVTPVNDAPVLVTPIPDQTGTQGEAFSLDLAAYFDDVDNDTLQFVVAGLPEGLDATAAGLISGTPTNAAALNSPYTITVTVSDDSESVSDSFELLVINVNDAPVVLGTINDQTAAVGAAFELDVSVHFSDPDNDALTFSAHGLPAGLSIDGTGKISGSAEQAGSFTVTVAAEDPDGAHVSTTFALVVSAAPASEPEAPVIDSEQNNVNQSGIVTVTESGVLNGGNITGTINNSGTVTGTVTLGAGSVINGGQISGTIRGNASQPARINNATIAPGSVLENVIINADVVLSAGVELGSNVRFSSANNIPPAIDLTPALSKLQWSVGDEREVLDLGGDVLAPDNGAMSIIRSIQLMSDFEPAGNQAVQDEGNGEIRVIMSDTRHTVLPVKISQAMPEDEEGVYINSDGDIVLVTASRRVVVNHPVLDSNPAFREALAAMGLQLDFDARTNLIVSESSAAALMFSSDARQATVMALNSSAVPTYYAGRPDVSAVPAHRSDVPGIHSYPVTGLANVEALSLIFAADDGTLLEQDIAPVPAHWSALKQSLQLLPGASDVRIDTLGVISLVLDGQNVRGRMDYRVERHPNDPSGTDYVAFDPAGDVNGDGVDDFLLRYPNGDRQLLYVYP